MAPPNMNDRVRDHDVRIVIIETRHKRIDESRKKWGGRLWALGAGIGGTVLAGVILNIALRGH